jgi:nitroreductase
MESTLQDIKERRSIRQFKAEQVKAADLDKVLEAGTWAPSGGGKQGATIVAVQDKATRDQLEALNAVVLKNPAAKPFFGAPTVIAVLTDPAVNTPLEDGTLALGNMLLAATAIGLGACWIHRAKPIFESSEGKALLKKWKLPENLVGVGFCILGYPEGDKPKAAPRKAGYIVKV